MASKAERPIEPKASAKCSGELTGCLGKAGKRGSSATSNTISIKAERQARAGVGVSGTSGDGGEGGAQRRLVFTAPAPPPPEFDEFTDAYLPLQEGGGVCGMAGFGGTDDCRLRLSTDPEPPSPDSEDPGDPNDPNAQPVTYITITPYQAALMAAAYLPLQPGQPTVGPPPSINKWKTAAVGYPLWIWADGDLDPAPVSRSVSGLSVTLDADLAKIVYDMGDGTIITCGTGTPWRKGNVPAGTPSPDCGHTYTKPSLPEGDYTITATTQWAVAWTAGGQSGTIPFTQTSSTTLPVGEIQTLVR